jgi:hypothetical protein
MPSNLKKATWASAADQGVRPTIYRCSLVGKLCEVGPDWQPHKAWSLLVGPGRRTNHWLPVGFVAPKELGIGGHMLHIHTCHEWATLAHCA